MHFWIIWQSLSITEKGGHKLGQPHGRPTSLVGRPWGGTPLFNPVHRELMALPLPKFYQFHLVFFLPLLSLLLFLSKFIRKRRKKKYFLPLHPHLHFVFTFFSSQERVWGGSTTPQERFCGASSPTRTILWSVITHKNDFCERQPCPTRTANSWTADLDFH